MFLGLLFVTVVVAFAVSALTAWIFTKPLDSILKRIIADAISSAWLRYLQFAILVVGISSGVRVHDLERYLGPSAGSAQTSGLSLDRWVWELYQTTIEALLGIAWVLLVFFVFALIAYVIVRIGEMRSGQNNAAEPSGPKE